MTPHSFHDGSAPARFPVQRGAVAAFAAKSLAEAGSANAAQILARLYRPTLDARELVAMLEEQPLLALRILKAANGALYGQAGRIGTLERGVQLIGLDAVRGIAAAACLNRRLFATPADGLADAQTLYAHSLATAVAARELAQLVQPELAGQAFLAGLVHDLGIALLANIDSAAWAGKFASIDASSTHPAELIAREVQLLGLDHATAAAVAFEAWKLPAWLGEAVTAHHDPEQAPEDSRTLARCLFLADRLAARCNPALHHGDWTPELDAEIAGALGLDAGELAGLAATVQEKQAGLSGALNS